MSQTKAQLLDGKSATIQFTGGSASAPSVSFTGDTNTGIYSPGADQVAISTGGSGRLFVDASGRLGVGTSSPVSTLSIRNDSLGSGGLTETAIALTYSSTNYGQHFIDANGTYNIYANNNGVAGGNLQLRADTGLIFNTASNERLRITSAGLVGIGTSSVTNSANLDIQLDTVPATDTYAKLQLRSGNYGYIIKGGLKQGAGGQLHFDLNNNGSVSTQMVLDTGGRLGIGTTSPGGTLDVGAVAGAVTAGDLTVTTGSTTAKVTIGRLSSTGNDSTSFRIRDRVDRDVLTVDAGNFVYSQSGTERARIDSSGRLLVGTSSALTNVLIKGDLASSAATTPQEQFALATNTYNAGLSITNYSANDYGSVLSLNSSNSNTLGTNTLVDNGIAVGIISFNGNDGANFVPCAEIKAAVDGTPGANDMPGRLVFSTTADGASSPTERMRIGQNGYIQCSETGTYSPDGGSVWHKFYQSVNERCLQTYNTTGTFTNYALTQYIAAGGGTGSGFASGFSDSGSIQRYIIFSNGNIQNTNNSYGAISDLKLKENIVDASEQWNDIKNLRVRKYNLKQGGAHTQIGVIAQEIELVSPGLVYETTDRDTDGNDLGTVTKNVNYSVLYMKAVKALQEAMERIEQLESEMIAVKAQLS